MSVKLGLTVVMRMQTVSILRGATLVYVSLDTLEMDFPVLVRHPCTKVNSTYEQPLPIHPLTDIDECNADTHSCPMEAYCTNTDGGYNCTCSSGYTGNGITCNG